MIDIKKHVTFLMLHLGYGGLEKQTITLINNLMKTDKYDITIVSVYDLSGKSFYTLDERVNIKYLLPYGPNKKQIKEALNSFKVISLIKETYRGLRIINNKFKLMKKEIKKLDTDIIVSTRPEFAKLIKREDTFNITQEHSYITNRNYLNSLKKDFKYIHSTIVMTDICKKLYDKYLGSNRVIKIGNIIEKKKDVHYNIMSKQLVTCGRLEKEKRFDILIDIFNKFNKINPEYTLKIIGAGSEMDNLKDKVLNLDLENKIEFTGRLDQNEINKEYIASSIFCLTSKKESFSLVLGDAMSYSVPCISFNVQAGPIELIEDGRRGFLVDDMNIDEYVSKLCTLANDDNLRKDLGLNGYEYIDKFNEETITSKWDELLYNRG